MPRLDQFAGERPVADAHKLRNRDATVARNVKLWSGSIEPLRDTALERTTALAQTPEAIFRYSGDLWLEWEQAVDVVRSPVGNDPHDRVFFTGTGSPRVADNTRATSGAGPFPGASLRLGVPAPSTAPALSKTGTPDDPNELPETRFYVTTYVNAFAEEGPPSLSSVEIEVFTGESVVVTFPGAPSGSFEITAVRIYRTNGGIFQFVGEAGIAASEFTDSVATASLGEELATTEWDMPPDDAAGMTSVAGAFLAAHRGNEVLLSEIGLPHAWPVRYRVPIDTEVVGLGTFASTVVVCTKGKPYILSGTDPASLSVAETEIRQSCTSARGIVSTGAGVVYPSPDGLIYVSGAGAQLLTEAIFEREQWQALKPDSMRAVFWERLYLCFYDTGTETAAFVINPEQPDSGVVFFDAPAVGGLRHDLERDATYLATGDEVREWDAGTPMTGRWRSRKIDAAAPVVLGVIRALADTHPVTLRAWADGELVVERVVRDNAPRRFPPVRARTWQIEVELGAGAVRELAVSASISALRRGE